MYTYTPGAGVIPQPRGKEKKARQACPCHAKRNIGVWWPFPGRKGTVLWFAGLVRAEKQSWNQGGREGRTSSVRTLTMPAHKYFFGLFFSFLLSFFFWPSVFLFVFFSMLHVVHANYKYTLYVGGDMEEEGRCKRDMTGTDNDYLVQTKRRRGWSPQDYPYLCRANLFLLPYCRLLLCSV